MSSKQVPPRFAALAAILMTIGLFVIGGHPQAGLIFTGNYHWLAHFLAYAAIALVYCLAMPGQTWLLPGLIVAGIGAAHEFYEITAHSHDYEYPDALVNGIGAFAGAAFGAFLKRQASSQSSP